MSVRRRFVDGPFGQIHLRDSGPVDGDVPALVCLHQSPKSGREFATILPVLAETRRVVAIDSPGHGESDLPPSASDATIANYARSAWAAIDALDLGTVDLLGHHTGAKVATEMAYQRPDDVRRIVMVSALVLSQAETDAFRAQFQPVPIDEAGTRFHKMWAKSVQYRGPGVSLEQLADSFAENLRAGDAYEWGHEAAFDYNPVFAERVQTLPHPIAVINPGDMLYDHTPRVMPLLQNGQLIDRPDWGFGFMDVQTEAAAQTIADVLA